MHRKITNHKTENFNKRENFSKEMERQLKELKISNQSWNFNKIKLHSNKKSREDSKNTT
jgi:LDH2 family malate/lactate/ureidoglycolate dehydrogenase